MSVRPGQKYPRRLGLDAFLGASDRLTDSSSDSGLILRRALAGEADAVDCLLARYRDRLKSMVRIHMDQRLAGRFDASDVVQDTLLHAAQQMPRFESAGIPFYIWLRQIARDRLSELYQRHVSTKKRSVLREQDWGLSHDSVSRLAIEFGHTSSALVDRFIAEEMRERLHQALAELPSQQREILVMRHLEQMSVSEIAAACELSEGAVKMRQLRAVQRLREIFARDSS